MPTLTDQRRRPRLRGRRRAATRPFVLVHGLHRLPRRLPRAAAGAGAARAARSSTTIAATAIRPRPATRRATPSRSSSTIWRGLLDARDVARCDLLGHSMGGMLALRFVARAIRERVASLVLMDTAGARLTTCRALRWPPPARSPRSDGMATLAGAAARPRRTTIPARPAAERRLEREMGRELLGAAPPPTGRRWILKRSPRWRSSWSISTPLTDRSGRDPLPDAGDRRRPGRRLPRARRTSWRAASRCGESRAFPTPRTARSSRTRRRGSRRSARICARAPLRPVEAGASPATGSVVV